MNDFIFKTCAMHAMQGFLASDSGQDRKYINQPDSTRFEQVAIDSMKMAEEMMKQFDKRFKENDSE
jgi:hypothetical protein